MRNWLPLVLVMLAGAGCWSERAPSKTTPPALAAVERPPEPWPSSARGPFVRRVQDRCAIVIAHVFDLTKLDSNGRLPASVLDELLSSTIESCHETEWSEEILGCYEETASTSETSDCYRSMTNEQRDDFEKRFTDIMQRHHSSVSHGASPPPPSPPPP